MADNGVRTTDLTPDTLLDDVMGNREGSLVRVPMSNLAAQLAASGEIAARIDEVEALVTTGARLAATWAALVSASGEFDGQGGEVLDADTGTHSQATATGYDGTTVPNAGRYVWSDGWSRWVRLGDTGLAGKADLAALDAEASAREGGDDALSAELAKLGLYKAQAVSFTDGAYRHRTTGVQESVSGLATGVVSPVTPGEVGRFTSSITGSAGAVASIVFLTAGDVVVSSVAAAPGVGTTKAYTREPFTVPAGAVKLAYTVLSSEIGTALLEIRRNTSGALAQARDDLDEIIGATQGFAVVEAAVTVGRYWHYSTGVFTALGSTGIGSSLARRSRSPRRSRARRRRWWSGRTRRVIIGPIPTSRPEPPSCGTATRWSCRRGPISPASTATARRPWSRRSDGPRRPSTTLPRCRAR